MSVLALLCALLLAFPAGAATFRVNPAGTDSPTCGGPSTQCLTGQQAVENAYDDDSNCAGDEVVFENGTYAAARIDSPDNGCDGASGNPFVIRAENALQATLHGGTQFAMSVCDAGNCPDIPAGDRPSVCYADVTVATIGAAFWDPNRAWIFEDTEPLIMATEQVITTESPQLMSRYRNADSEGAQTITEVGIPSGLDAGGVMAYIHGNSNLIYPREITLQVGDTITYATATAGSGQPDQLDFDNANNNWDIRNWRPYLSAREFVIEPDVAGSRRVYAWPDSTASCAGDMYLGGTVLNAINLFQGSDGAQWWEIRDFRIVGYSSGDETRVGGIRGFLSGTTTYNEIVIDGNEFHGNRGTAIAIQPAFDVTVSNNRVTQQMLSNWATQPRHVTLHGEENAPPYTPRATGNLIDSNYFGPADSTRVNHFSNDGMAICSNEFDGPGGVHGNGTTSYRGNINTLVRWNWCHSGNDRCVAIQDVEGPYWATENVWEADGESVQSAVRNWSVAASVSNIGPINLWNNTAVATGPKAAATAGNAERGVTVRATETIRVHNMVMYGGEPCGNPPTNETPESTNAWDSHGNNIFEVENPDWAGARPNYLCGTDPFTMPASSKILEFETEGILDVIHADVGGGSSRQSFIHKIGGLADDTGVDPETITDLLPSALLFTHAGACGDFTAIRDHPGSFNIGAFPIIDSPSGATPVGPVGGTSAGGRF